MFLFNNRLQIILFECSSNYLGKDRMSYTKFSVLFNNCSQFFFHFIYNFYSQFSRLSTPIGLQYRPKTCIASILDFG